MTPLDQQIISFLTTVVLGLTMGAIFDFYYILRRFLRPRKVFIHIGDLLIWLFMIALVFVTLIYINWGEVRFYVFLGIALGALIYYLIFSRYIKIIYEYLIKTVLKILNIVKSIILLPFKLIARGFLYLVGIISIFLMWATKPLRRVIGNSRFFIKLKYQKDKVQGIIRRLKKFDPFKRI
ncbi:spore cortex biosynthesis protein YabQ [Desulfitibacter alkalitolerans]|uniref:spore cortex biosynthesis protein YabQ n=1 Tax=Desulfitibacter alkalitolerans TaxID=264641 RepID=UPI000686813D